MKKSNKKSSKRVTEKTLGEVVLTAADLIDQASCDLEEQQFRMEERGRDESDHYDAVTDLIGDIMTSEVESIADEIADSDLALEVVRVPNLDATKARPKRKLRLALALLKRCEDTLGRIAFTWNEPLEKREQAEFWEDSLGDTINDLEDTVAAA